MKSLAIIVFICSLTASAQISNQKIKDNKYRKALETHVKQNDSSTAEFYYQRANIRLNYTDNVEAIKDYNRALLTDPANPKIFYNRGLAKMNLWLLKEAIFDFDKAIALNPNNAYAYNNRSVCRYMLDDYIGAIQDSSMAIAIDPANAEAHNNRGISKIKMGKLNEGCEDLKKAYELGDKKSMAGIKKYCGK